MFGTGDTLIGLSHDRAFFHSPDFSGDMFLGPALFKVFPSDVADRFSVHNINMSAF